MPGAVEPVQPVLETAAAALAEATAHPPYLFELPLAEGRRAVEEMQGCGVAKAVIEEEWITVPGGPTGSVRVRIVKPTRTEGALPVILYLHGAGWVFGGARTHDRLVRELAVGVEAAVVFPEYALSPEARYPVAIEQNYAVAQWVVRQGAAKGMDGTRIAVAGDSAGGNMAIALTLMANERGDVPLVYQLLFSPVTDAAFDTDSYHRFATGYFLRRDGMRWLWDQYTIDEAERARITVSPLRASTEQLTGLPPALIITAEADVLRDEGEAYAGNLRAAGVPVVCVRFSGAINDFVVLDALRGTCAAEAAITLSADTLRAALYSA
ncbi:alpha/beta hydrolase [Streptomyces gelaticus]|uniref:alpha/beta hydrolase n=1 Tax=Streptomyces gelaticus TaxID=285446 RepID=UPI0037A39221